MRIAIVNDVAMVVEALKRIVLSEPENEVAWTAVDGAEGVKKCAGDVPDLILMDLIMPEMDGVEATRMIMAQSPCPILLVTTSVNKNASMVFEAMGAGALDAVNTPKLGFTGTGEGKAELLKKIHTIGRLKGAERRKILIKQHEAAKFGTGSDWLIAIGASTGGPAAIAKVLSRFRKDLPAAVAVVQHVDQNFTQGLAEWLGTHTELPVRIARKGDTLKPGVVMLAGTNDHLIIQEDSTLDYTPDPVSLPYRPSVDVFFESVIRNWHGKAVAALLTGMGRDGAEGLLRLRQHGVYTVAQNAETCKVFGMPKAAVEIKAAVDVLPIGEIGDALLKKIHPQHSYIRS